MRLVRALARHVGLWAALLLGLLVGTAVVILYSTPGPWHAASGAGQVAKPPASAASDLAVFVVDADPTRHCVGVIWVHAEPGIPSVSVMVVPSLAQGFLPGGGYEPVSRIVDEAGPAAGASALAGMTGTKVDGWVTVGLGALQVAFPDAFPTIPTRDAMFRLRQSLATWAGRGTARAQFERQKAFVDLALTQTDFGTLNVVAFANFVLASSGVRSNIDLQTAASVAAALRDLGTSAVDTAALPAVVDSTGVSSVWRLDAGSLLAVGQSLALGTAPPPFGPQVTTSALPATVVIVTEPLGSLQRPFVASLAQRLRASSGQPVRVVPVVVAPGVDVATQLAAVLDARRPQAVLVALGWGVSDSAVADVKRQLTEVTALLGRRAQPAVIAAPPGGDSASAVADVVTTAAQRSGLPLSPAATAVPNAASRQRQGVVAGAWADAAFETLARACDPALFAPRLAATRLGIGFYTRVHTRVAVMGVGAVQTTASARLRACGWAAAATAAGSWSPTLRGGNVYCHAGEVTLARAVAGDLGRSGVRVIVDASAPAAITVVAE